MRRLIASIGFQCYALLLAGVQLHAGVRTDEAKYLLNIPYPHPPVARWIMGLTDSWAGQEILWRAVMATLLVQAVWLVYGIAASLPTSVRTAVCAAWLCSAAVVFQAGTVMMAPLTALHMLVFVWVVLREKENGAYPYLLALFWLVSLFTAYQAVLFAPLVFMALWRTRQPWWKVSIYWAIPLGLLGLYTLGNPLAAASMVIHAGKDASQTLVQHITETGWIWVLGGSGLISVLGTLGLFIRPRWSLVLSFTLVAAYVFLSRYDYYAILFTPLLVAGFLQLLRRVPALALPTTFLLPVATALVIFLHPPALSPSPLLEAAMPHLPTEGTLLIAGSFGHEWQYASWSPVLRYRPNLLASAEAVVCLVPCEDMHKQPRWTRLLHLPVELWLKQQ